MVQWLPTRTASAVAELFVEQVIPVWIPFTVSVSWPLLSHSDVIRTADGADCCSECYWCVAVICCCRPPLWDEALRALNGEMFVLNVMWVCAQSLFCSWNDSVPTMSLSDCSIANDVYRVGISTSGCNKSRYRMRQRMTFFIMSCVLSCDKVMCNKMFSSTTIDVKP